MNRVSGAELANLMVLRSVCLTGQGRFSQIITPGGSFYDPRQVRSLLEALARHFAVDLVALRLRCRELLNQRNYLPLPFSAQLVLVPLTLGREGEKTGYINLLSLERVLSQGGASILFLKGGIELDCWLSLGVVRERLVRAKFVYLELSSAGVLSVPGASEIWRQKMQIIRTILQESFPGEL